MIRVYNIAIAAFCVFVSCFLLEIKFNYQALITIFIISLVMAGGYIMNDILDVNSDKINHPNRPIARGEIKPPLIKLSALILSLFLIFISTHINSSAICFLYFFIIPGLFFYNLYLKKTPLFGNILISVMLGSVFLFTELVLIETMSTLSVPFALTVFFSLAREMIKDMADYEGDILENMQTLPIVLGMTCMRKFVLIWIFFLIILFIMPYYLFDYGLEYLFLLILFVEIPLIYSLFLLIKFPTKETYKYLAAMFKILCVNGLLAIMTSKINLYV